MKFNQVIRTLLFSKKRPPNFGKYALVQPGQVSERKFVPDNIKTPSYYHTGEPKEQVRCPDIKNERQIQGMKDSCRLAANILKTVGESIKVRIDMISNEISTRNHLEK